MTVKEMEETGLWWEAIDTFIGQLYFYIITAHIGEIKRKRPPSSILGLYMERDMVCMLVCI